MKILVINTGSSSLKYQLFDMNNEKVLARGLCERIGIESPVMRHSNFLGKSFKTLKSMSDHHEAINEVVKALTDDEYGVISDMNEISAVGHRVVHGGEKFSNSAVIDDEVIQAIKDCIDLAPLHNPPNIIGIEACKKLMPKKPMVAVFDTAFHQTIPQYAYMYAIPYRLYQKYGIRKYGFHGTSHKFVAERAAIILNRPLKNLKLVTCHLGNGSSICAVDGGKSVETSMGFTPLDGLAMGTRSGSIDPAVALFLMEKENLSVHEINNILNKESGVLGISGISSDFRDLDDAAAQGNERAVIALELFAYRVRKYIGEYTTVMGGLDAVIFTAGIGENNVGMRKRIYKGLEFLGIKADDEKNEVRGKEIDISSEDAKVKTLVIPTNEELAIAREAKRLLEK